MACLLCETVPFVTIASADRSVAGDASPLHRQFVIQFFQQDGQVHAKQTAGSRPATRDGVPPPTTSATSPSVAHLWGRGIPMAWLLCEMVAFVTTPSADRSVAGDASPLHGQFVIQFLQEDG